MDAHLRDRRALRRPLHERSEQRGVHRQLALQRRGDFVALGHDVVEQHVLRRRGLERLPKLHEVVGGADHRLVGEHVEPRVDRADDVLGLARVVAGDDHDVAGAVGEHPLEEVRAGVDPLHPVRGLLLARVEALDAREVLLEVVAPRRVHVHDAVDVRIHELLDERRVKVPGIEREQPETRRINACALLHDLLRGRGAGGGHDEERREGGARAATRAERGRHASGWRSWIGRAWSRRTARARAARASRWLPRRSRTARPSRPT